MSEAADASVIAKDFLAHKIRCDALLPGRVHTPFVDGFIAKVGATR